MVHHQHDDARRPLLDPGENPPGSWFLCFLRESSYDTHRGQSWRILPGTKWHLHREPTNRDWQSQGSLRALCDLQVPGTTWERYLR